MHTACLCPEACHRLDKLKLTLLITLKASDAVGYHSLSNHTDVEEGNGQPESSNEQS